MMFSTADPKRLDELERDYFHNYNADNTGFMHSSGMTILAGGISVLSVFSSIFLATRSVKEISRVGHNLQLINWQSKSLRLNHLSQISSKRSWPSLIPKALRSWDAVIQGNGKMYLVNTQGNPDILKKFTNH